MKRTEAEKLAWAAGFFDGEGCTSLAGKRYLRVTVSQMHREPLDRFKAAVFGFGGVCKPSPRQKAFVYKASGVEALQVLQLLWPYLCSIKKAQAKMRLAQVNPRRASSVDWVNWVDI